MLRKRVLAALLGVAMLVSSWSMCVMAEEIDENPNGDEEYVTGEDPRR